jgi:transcriptional regulator with XRE-family HTH domain
MDKEMEILKQLKNLRLSANLTEEEMGVYIGYNAKVVSAIEAGNRPVGLKTIIKWSEAVKKEISISFK